MCVSDRQFYADAMHLHTYAHTNIFVVVFAANGIIYYRLYPFNIDDAT